ncbi:MAG: winged helix DNA-binding domain-containing protein [Thermoplasmata archaeon]|nr:winged helix DNA-binding domain-containing protein [Thermoplasmata archaeon]
MSSATRSKPPEVAGTGISWTQTTAFRLRRHHLSARAPPTALRSVVADMGGAQAQVLRAAQMSIWARVRDLKEDDLETALWKDRILAKAWGMRRTLFLLPSDDLAIFVRGSARRAEKEIRWMLNHGVSEQVLERLVRAVLFAMDTPSTRSELARRVSKSLKLPLRWERGGGWGSQRMIPCVQLGDVTCPAYYLLHLAGARGVLCSGPSEGNEATFVRADAWLRDWRDVPRERAESELLQRYLGSFGPATVADFVAWTGMGFKDAGEIWAREEASFAPVNVEGWPAWILRRDLSELEDSKIERPTVRILPYFDSFLLGHMKRTHLVETRDLGRVYRNQGWVAPVVLVDGRVKGVWTHVENGKRLSVRVEPFGPVPRLVSAAIREEGRDLGRFLGCESVEVNIG